MIERVQAQLLAGAGQNMEAVAVPPFTCFFNPDDPDPGFNFGIPHVSQTADWTEGIHHLGNLFRNRRRTPRLEYIQEYAPGLAPALEAEGYALELRSTLMLCTPEALRTVPAPTHARLAPIQESDPLSMIQDFMTVQRRSFGAEDAAAPSLQEAWQFRSRLSRVRFFAGLYGDQMVSVASLMQVHDRVTEIAGIATLPGYRRRGLATALTAAVAAVAFTEGAEAVFLTAGSPEAGRVYEGVGFKPIGHGLAYRLEGVEG